MTTCAFCGDTYDVIAVNQCPSCRSRRRSFPGATFATPAHDTPIVPVLDLFTQVLATDPGYLPGVSSGTVRLVDWYHRKNPQWTRTVTVNGAPVAHVAARLNDVLPDGRRLTGNRMWEMGMFVVHPDHRRNRYATELAELTARVFGDRLWATAHTDTPGHRMLTNLGWTELDSFHWADDTHPGLALAAPNGSPR